MAVHEFVPERYHNTIGSHPPALRIAPGDTVVTTTLDALGRDARGERVAGGPNPVTGPFYVEGAEVGDALAVRFDHLWPNRAHGWTAAGLAPNTVDPDAVRDLPVHAGLAEWDLDLERGTATLRSPATRLGALTLPFAPMLGCVGVAPPLGQAITTMTSGPWGGNMDYRGFTTGVTVYLPVFVPGALLHLGDGHARQGDGEIAGTGIEVSFDVRFTVDVLRGARLRWPRGETADEIFAVGNARPLDQALQHATTEMYRWLLEDGRTDPTGACLLLGQCVCYDVGNVYDPAYTVVCRLPKARRP